MDFSKIIAVSGKPGLYEILSQTKSGVIVKSLAEGKRMPITATHNVSLLENIAIFTYEEDVPLGQIFSTIATKENNGEAISHKESGNKLVTYFEEILPDYDQERVYTSNIKKVFQWYNLLVKAGFDFSTLNATTSTEEE